MARHGITGMTNGWRGGNKHQRARRAVPLACARPGAVGVALRAFSRASWRPDEGGWLMCRRSRQLAGLLRYEHVGDASSGRRAGSRRCLDVLLASLAIK